MLNYLTLRFVLCFFISYAVDYESMFVYRAESTSSLWRTHLLNVNAANIAGVLSYLHADVIPEDMGSGQGHGCKRRNNIDIIMQFYVTLVGDLSSEMYMNYENGTCTNITCEEIYKEKGYYVGMSSQNWNPQHKYTNAKWYSFPERGFCVDLDGSYNCTYMARLVGWLKIDDLINSKEDVIIPNYFTWCETNTSHIEMKRISSDHNYSCSYFNQSSIAYWNGICVPSECNNRVQSMNVDLFNTSLPNGCNSKINRNVFLYNQTCVSLCPDAYYSDWNYICQPCDHDLHCKQCNWVMSPNGDGGNNCNSCGEAYPFMIVESKSRCVNSCPTHYYPDLSNKCEMCNSSCGNCSGPRSDQCTSCPNHLYFFNHMCIANCPIHYFADTMKICQECSSWCANCISSPDHCTSCVKNSTRPYLSNLTCVKSCHNGYPDSNDVCHDCVQPCITCIGINNCTTCIHNTYQFEGNCLIQCPMKYYADERRICQPCVQPCLTCIGITNCTTCDDGTFQLGGSCVNQCPIKYYANEKKICRPCSKLCDICISHNQCINCTNNSYIFDKICYKQCPPFTKAIVDSCVVSGLVSLSLITIGISIGIVLICALMYLCFNTPKSVHFEFIELEND